MSNRIRTAVLGAAGYGMNLIRNLTRLETLDLVCEPDEDVRSQLRKSYPDLEQVGSFETALKRKGIHAVVVGGPVDERAELAKRALKAGKHVLVERPLVCSDADAKSLVTRARENGLVFMVDHLLCFHPAFVKLKTLVDEGALGKIRYIQATRNHNARFRVQDHPVYAFAPNDLAMILALAKVIPSAVTSLGGPVRQGVAEVTHTHLDFHSGLQAHIIVSWVHHFRRQQLVVAGANQTAVFDDTLPWKQKLRLFNLDANPTIQDLNEADATAIPVAGVEPLFAVCEHFLDCITHEGQPRTGGRFALDVVHTVNAALRSQRDHDRRVDMPGEEPVEEEAPPSTLTVDYFVHPSSVIDDDVTIGMGSKIWHFSHILSGCRLGDKANIGQNVVIGPDVTIGRNCKIQNNVSVYKGVTLEDDVFCGPSMVFTNVAMPRSEISRKDEFANTLVKKGATIGANATIVCGNNIGRYAFVGAGSVVTHDVADHSLVYGNPARFVDWVCSCGARLSKKLGCPVCGKTYMKEGSGLTEIIEDETEKPKPKARAKSTRKK
ncbi:MAG: Gfo/Idh/MocA family oxidoreductase [Acidobacteriota bacterium]|nr:Gfo/Idh/MocA family oxidoreductase [Acidobacteriota bacterium]